MKTIREHLGLKLFLANLAVILAGLLILALTIQFVIPSVLTRHINMMGQGMMNGMGMGQGQGQGYGRTLFESFRSSMSEALVYAVSASTLAALIVSWILSRRIVAPVRDLTLASERIADGHYDERVTVTGSDEIAQLAGRFNSMAAQLEQVEARRLQLIGDVTHELRTPLTSIKGYMEGLVDGVLPAGEETFEQVRSEANRLSRLVDDLQELSRVEAGAFSLDLQPVSIESLVQATLKRLAPQAAAKQVRLAAETTQAALVLADADRITQVLVNLVGNAIQYSREGGEVVVATSEESGMIWTSVRDDGIGIPAEHLPQLFTRFYRVDKSRSRASGGGSGIGLTIARHLVEAHGGRIQVESPGAGLGSTFSFSLKKAA